MSSLYKKIALICLVSLTANQAVQAFQFSDVWGWVKGNQKTTAGIVGTLAALIAIYCYASNKKTTPFSPVQLYVNSDTDFTGWSPDHILEGVRARNIRRANIVDVSVADQDSLTELCQHAPVYHYVNREQNYFLRVMRDPAKKNKIVGCLAYHRPELRNLIAIKDFGIDHTYASKDRIKIRRALLNSLLATTADLQACDDVTRFYIKDRLQETGDMRPYDSHREQRERFFDRSHLRPARVPVQNSFMPVVQAAEPVLAVQAQPAQEHNDHAQEPEIPEEA